MTMHQQINLYQPVFRKQAIVFSATTLLQIAAAVLVLLLIVSGHARWALADMTATVQALETQVAGLGQQLGEIEDGQRTPDTEALDSEIDQLQQDIDQRNLLLTRFDQLVTQHENGFAAQFRALAEERLPGLWLEGITVNDSNRIEIRGITLDAKLVPKYLQQLERHKGLSKTAFEAVAMNRIDPDRPEIQFVLRNFRGQAAWN